MTDNEKLINLLKIANYHAAQRRDQLGRCQERCMKAEKLAADRKRTIALLQQERKCLLSQLAIQEHENQLLESLYAPTSTAQVSEKERAESASSSETSGAETATAQEA
jgi:hypothetical protein